MLKTTEGGRELFDKMKTDKIMIIGHIKTGILSSREVVDYLVSNSLV